MILNTFLFLSKHSIPLPYMVFVDSREDSTKIQHLRVKNNVIWKFKNLLNETKTFIFLSKHSVPFPNIVFKLL